MFGGGRGEGPRSRRLRGDGRGSKGEKAMKGEREEGGCGGRRGGWMDEREGNPEPQSSTAPHFTDMKNGNLTSLYQAVCTGCLSSNARREKWRLNRLIQPVHLHPHNLPVPMTPFLTYSTLCRVVSGRQRPVHRMDNWNVTSRLQARWLSG